jgi:hypothetical protein
MNAEKISLGLRALLEKRRPGWSWLSHFRHSRMLLAGIQANFGLGPPMKTFGGDGLGRRAGIFIFCRR